MYFRHKQNPNADFLDNNDSSSGSESENNQTIEQELANKKKPVTTQKGRPTNIPLITSNKALIKGQEKPAAEEPVFRNNFFHERGQSHQEHSEISEIERIGSVFNKSDEQIREVSSQAERSPSFKPVTKIPNFNVISKVPAKKDQDSIDMSSSSDPVEGKDSEDLKIPLGSKKIVTPGRESSDPNRNKPPSDRNFFTETPGFKRDVKMKTESNSNTHTMTGVHQEEHTSAHTWKKEEPKSQSIHSEKSKRQLKKAQFMPPDSKTGQIIPAYRQYVLDESINQQQVYMPHLSDREILEAFNALDINKDGHITSDEIAYFLEALEEEATEAEIEEMIKMLDIEGTGRVRYEEFYKLATGKNLNPISQAYPPSLDILEKKKTSDAKRRGEDGMETSGRAYDMKTRSYRDSPAGHLDMSGYPREKSKFEQKQNRQRMEDFEDEESRPPRTDREERDSSFKGFIRQAGLTQKAYMERYDKIEFSNEPWISKATYQDFLNFFSMNSNDAARRVFALISKDRNYVDMKQMMIALSLYLENSNEEKVLLAYKLFDPDGRDGYILYNELLRIFKVFLIGEDQKKIEKKIKTILNGKSLNPDDSVSKEEFLLVCKNFPDLFN